MVEAGGIVAAVAAPVPSVVVVGTIFLDASFFFFGRYRWSFDRSFVGCIFSFRFVQAYFVWLGVYYVGRMRGVDEDKAGASVVAFGCEIRYTRRDEASVVRALWY